MPSEINLSGNSDNGRNGYIYKQLSNRISSLESDMRVISNSISEFNDNNSELSQIKEMLLEMQKDITKIKAKVGI